MTSSDKDENYFEWLLSERQRLTTLISETQNDLDITRAKIKLECKHTNRFTSSKYHEGNYDHVSMTQTWDECLDCGAKFNLSTKYGTFQ